MNKYVFLSILFVGGFLSITSAQVKYTSDGNFGIGTTNPDYEVHVKNASPTLKLETNVSNGNTTLRLTEASSFPGGFISYNGSSNYLNIGVHNDWDTDESNDIISMSMKRGDGNIGMMRCVGIGIANPSYKLDFWGPIAQFTYSMSPLRFYFTASDPRICSSNKVVFYNTSQTDHIDIEVDDCIETSDSTLKRDIKDIESGISVVNQLNGVTYFKKNEEEGQRRSGLIAQEVEKVLPGVVYRNDSTGIMLISYTKIIPYLVEAIKEQQAEIDELKSQISGSEAAYKSVMTQTSSDDFGEISSAELFQNVPNPFESNTIIKYSIPTIESYAMINVYDLNGKQVKSYNLTQTGNGEIVIPASELDPGLFIYNLIIDGIEIDSKRMVLTD